MPPRPAAGLGALPLKPLHQVAKLRHVLKVAIDRGEPDVSDRVQLPERLHQPLADLRRADLLLTGVVHLALNGIRQSPERFWAEGRVQPLGSCVTWAKFPVTMS